MADGKFSLKVGAVELARDEHGEDVQQSHEQEHDNQVLSMRNLR